MKLAHDIADDAGTFLEAGIWVQLQLPHGVQDTPMYWLHTVAHIRQATRCDGGQGIGEVAFAQGLPQRGIADFTAFENLCHGSIVPFDGMRQSILSGITGYCRQAPVWQLI